MGWGMLTSCSWYVDATLMGRVGWGGVGYVNVLTALKKNQGTVYVKLAARQQSLGSSAVDTLKKNMLQHVQENVDVETTTCAVSC